ncbi:MAG TPA: biotin-independent malonate decarboxylase subunit gamma [Spirochaetota bacterium]|nr:biotin-independent malonate decarboxylase subunit gamma [Spirochaetota bacterium]HPJ34230.1 biotin-independent malonate decarboxylase subunit gamma [Spirochaetota bacterium]
MDTFVGQGRAAIDFIIDEGSFKENQIDSFVIEDETFGPGAVIGTASVNNETATIIANDAMVFNEKFPVVFAGVIGMEEGYKMALAVYNTIKADADKPLDKKRPIILVVDTPGNGPGKVEEIFGMNKSTGAYQLALAEARKTGHPIVAMVVGRAISGAFLCHGLQADHILSLTKDFNVMIHVMPLTSIARITKQNIERLEELSTSNPVFAAGAEFFYKLGGVQELVSDDAKMRETVQAHIAQIRELKQAGRNEELGPWGRGLVGAEREGRIVRMEVIKKMQQEFDAVADKLISA